ncbi:MAG: signal peptide peptidase SppA [Oceanicaulis sp.]|jgi:protease-4|nr:signal peptide peptidase SppA [Oceanicaulis sp.]
MSSDENIVARIWRYIGAFQHGILRVFGIFVIGFFLIAFIGSLFSSDEFDMADSGVLIFAPEGPIVEEPTTLSPNDAFTASLLGGGPGEEVLLSDVVDGFRQAAEDDDVTAIVMNLERFGGGYPAALHQVAHEMEAFREAGKEIIVYGDNFSMSGYFLAAHASSVYLHDMGGASVTGYAVYRTFFRSLLDRLYVTLNVYRVGTFKSALEPYLGDEMSEPAAEANLYVFGDLWNAYQERVEAARGLPDGALQTYADTFPELLVAQNGDTAAVSLNAGLVDHVIGRGAYRDLLSERFGRDDENGGIVASNFFDYVEANREFQLVPADKIVVIKAVGGIVDGDGDGGVIGGDQHAELVRRARLDDNVRAIVLRIDSGGGSAFASELIREELEMARLEGKIVIASMGGVAASGGYWIATPAHEIWAEPTTITGSIGIFGFIPTFENSLAEIGVYEDGVATTATARQPSVTGGVTEEWDTVLQSSIEAGYERFLSIVAESRDMTRDEVDAVAQGRIWTGQQAFDRGLVDSIGGYDDAIAAAAERAGLEEGDYRVVEFRDEVDPFAQILQMLGQDARLAVFGEGLLGSGWLGDMARDAQDEIETINMMNDPNGVYASCVECNAFRINP